MTDRYSTSYLIEDQYEPGSHGKVLRNLLGITRPQEIEVAETSELWLVQEKLIREVSRDQSFTADDLCRIHREWLGKIYSWAGKPRSVNLSKGSFGFAMAQVIPVLLDEFERRQLRQYTPCLFSSRDEVAHALAESCGTDADPSVQGRERQAWQAPGDTDGTTGWFATS